MNKIGILCAVAFSVGLIWLSYEVRQMHSTIKPLIAPASSALETGHQSLKTFNANAGPAVKAIQDGTSAINNFKLPSWFRQDAPMFQVDGEEIVPLTNEQFQRLQDCLKAGGGDNCFNDATEPQPTPRQELRNK